MRSFSVEVSKRANFQAVRLGGLAQILIPMQDGEHMSPKKAFWSLLHIESKTQIDALTFPQASLLVTTFGESELANWAAWYEGLAEWQAVEDLLHVLQVEGKGKHAAVAPKPPQFTGTLSSAHTNSGAGLPPASMSEAMATITGVGALTPDARLSKRFLKKYKAFIQTKLRMHESQTVDLSLTGLQIADSLPAGSDGPFEVTLVNHAGEALQLICSVISDELRTRLKIVRAAKLDQLHNWLLNSAD